MMRRLAYSLILSLPVWVSAQSLRIDDGWFLVDGRKFFIKGVGYEPHTRPGQVPWEYSFNPTLLQADLQRIRLAGFNTIRTWSAMSQEELQVVTASGLKILFGIWIDPHGAYGDADFIQNALQHVYEVLAYSKYCPAIIGYLIMNEPTVADIYSGGAGNLLHLWQQVISLIQQEHPGIPISFANTAVGDYIRTDLFRFAAYNLYIYNPDLIRYSHGYPGYCAYLKSQCGWDKPFIVTEFGLSVSPGARHDAYDYGGNTLEQQTAGLLEMYRGLIDGGAQGGCVFQYHDGWWKGGNPAAHDDDPEEWFGLIEFDTNPGEPFGTPRPAWAAMTTYNQAIICQPRNQQVYCGAIPVELFLTENVDSFSVTGNGAVLLTEANPTTYYLKDLVLARDDSLADLRLLFRFYDRDRQLLKTEEVSVLWTRTALTLPELTVQVFPQDLTASSTAHLIVRWQNRAPFQLASDTLDYVCFPHIGFQAGERRQTTVNLQENSWSFTDQFELGADARVVTLGAGVTINYGTFSKRICDQRTVLRGDWADAIANPALTGTAGRPINECLNDFSLSPAYPNPFNPVVHLELDLRTSQTISAGVYNLQGQLIARLADGLYTSGKHRMIWDARACTSGIYLLRLQVGQNHYFQKLVLLK